MTAVTATEGRLLVFHWCPGCLRKKAIHDQYKEPRRLHADLLDIGESVEAIDPEVIALYVSIPVKG